MFTGNNLKYYLCQRLEKTLKVAGGDRRRWQGVTEEGGWLPVPKQNTKNSENFSWIIIPRVKFELKVTENQDECLAAESNWALVEHPRQSPTNPSKEGAWNGCGEPPPRTHINIAGRWEYKPFDRVLFTFVFAQLTGPPPRSSINSTIIIIIREQSTRYQVCKT